MGLVSGAWDFLSASAIFLAGIFIAYLLRKKFDVSATRALLLYLWHTVFCVMYAIWALTGLDALAYYRLSLTGGVDFYLGTRGVIYITSFFTSFLGWSYLSTFLLFGIFGFVGLLAFDSALRHVVAEKSRMIRRCATLVVFLPSVSFWSAALGKEPIAFFATGLALWASIDLKRRYVSYILAVAAMLVVRPHMAGFLVLAVGAAMMLQHKMTLAQKFLLGGIAIAAAALLVPLAMEYVGLGNEADSAQFIEYVEQRQSYNQTGGGAVDISSMSLPMQLFTYLFRPLPYEAFSLSSLAASLDNAFLLILFLVGLRGLFKQSSTQILGNRTFLWIYGLSSWLILAVTTANLGISVRQKWMFLPMLLCLVFSMIGKDRRGSRF